MITIKFDAQGLVDDLKLKQEALHSKVVEILQYAKANAVSEQRQASQKGIKPFQTQSGNLLSSIGGIITDRGEVVDLSGFEAIQGERPKADSLTPEGAVNEGKRVAEEVAQTHSYNPTLTMVAGMHYASYVADKGKDVLSTARLVAERIISEELERLQ